MGTSQNVPVVEGADFCRCSHREKAYREHKAGKKLCDLCVLCGKKNLYLIFFVPWCLSGWVVSVSLRVRKSRHTTSAIRTTQYAIRTTRIKYQASGIENRESSISPFTNLSPHVVGRDLALIHWLIYSSTHLLINSLSHKRRITKWSIKCAGSCKKFEYFQIFSNVLHQFSNIFQCFQTFSIVFERFFTVYRAFDWFFTFPNPPD